jgi:uncharacterized membrane protein YfcA
VTEPLPVAVLIFAVAILYSAVGQAGGTGYIAVMALAGLSPDVIRPTALLLNVLVASIATFRSARAGRVPWPMLWPFLAGSVPLALIGGSIRVPPAVYRPAVAIIILLAAAEMFRSVWRGPRLVERDGASAPRLASALAGGGIGLLAGLTGTGGGILLAPILLWTGWAPTRRAIGLSAGFILANSLAALAGNLASVRVVPAALPLWAFAAFAGGLVGTELGGRWLSPRVLRLLLGLILTVAGARLLLTG